MKNSNFVKLQFFFLLALFIVFSGCLLYDQQGNVINADKLKVDTSKFNLSEATNVCKELPGPTPCYCMICKNETPYLGILSFLSFLFDASLKGGSCNFSFCNISIAKEAIASSDDETQLRTFMFGYGPSFTSADKSNLFCNYSNQLAVKWLIGSESSPPEIPNNKQAECWLERNIIPVYIYYTNGKKIDPILTGQIASKFQGSGPVMLTSELVWNSSDDNQFEAVKEQIYNIKKNCPKCLSVLAVKSGDVDAVKRVFEDNTLYGGKNISQWIDLVGFGFLANDFPDCNLDRIIGYNIAFSRFILRNYSKPTIWLYAGISEGKNSNGICSFTSRKVREFYESLFSATPGLASSGIVGIIFYELKDKTGPIPCPSGQKCEYGLFYQNGSQKHPALNVWTDLCKIYTQKGARSVLVFSRNAQGSVCDALQDWKMSLLEDLQNRSDEFLKSEIIPMERQKKLNCGEVCVSDIKLQIPEVFIEKKRSFDSDNCEKYSIIDEYADDYEISNLYLRAMIQQESGFQENIFSCVDNSSSACNLAGLSIDEICKRAGRAEGCAKTLDGASSCPVGKKPCALGLAQCVELPGDSRMTSLCGKGQPYDPFNPDHSICCGAYKFNEALTKADQFLTSNWQKLSECESGLKREDFEWAKYYLASNIYYGGPAIKDQEFQAFLDQRDSPQKCKGIQNYITFLRLKYVRQSLPGLKDSEYGARQMALYLDAINKCESDCIGAVSLRQLKAGEAADARIFGDSFAQEAFEGYEDSLSSSIIFAKTIAKEGYSVQDIQNILRVSGNNNYTIIFVGSEKIEEKEEEDLEDLLNGFDSLFKVASEKTNKKIYVFNLINSNQLGEINKFNQKLESLASTYNGKIIIINTNQCLNWESFSKDKIRNCLKNSFGFVS